jgi:hypothetical protein
MRMRCALAAIAALMVVPAATASRPPIGSGQHVWRGATHAGNRQREQQRSEASCSAHAKKSLGWFERKLLPVACEQPPRPNLLLASAIAAFIP